MFTGIIQKLGIVSDIKGNQVNKTFAIECSDYLDDVSLGDSISINGACQTVTKLSKNQFEFFSSEETLKITNLGQLKTGDKVNLEKAATLSSFLGGHLVTGHIDGMGEISSIKKVKEDYEIGVRINSQLMKYVINKGSIAINGISLTIGKKETDNILIYIIPHTFEKTNLKYLKKGSIINIETDIIGKYVENFVNQANKSKSKKSSNLDKDILKNYGYIV